MAASLGHQLLQCWHDESMNRIPMMSGTETTPGSNKPPGLTITVAELSTYCYQISNQLASKMILRLGREPSPK